MLLVALKNMEVRTFQYDGKLFVSTDIQFTGGSFGKGVSSLRTYNLNGENVVGMYYLNSNLVLLF